jgi:hypothetical protein
MCKSSNEVAYPQLKAGSFSLLAQLATKIHLPQYSKEQLAVNNGLYFIVLHTIHGGVPN